MLPVTCVQVGASNGTMAEVSGPEVKEGMEVVVGNNGATANPVKSNVSTPSSPSPPVTSAVNPAADLNALKGEWKVVKFEKGKEAESSWDSNIPGMEPIVLEKIKGAVFFNDDDFSFVVHEEGRETRFSVLRLIRTFPSRPSIFTPHTTHTSRRT